MSAADLIDGKNLTVVDKKERAEFVKRKLEAKERENEIIARLGKIGGGAGREYMKAATSRRALLDGSHDAETRGIPASQGSIGFGRDPAAPTPSIGARSREQAIQLGPMKRKRADSALSGLSSSSRLSRTTQSTVTATNQASKPTSALGWGGNLKDKLSRMREGEKLRKEEELKRRQVQEERTSSPVRKKTRFVTEKGIREAGRESLGNELAGRQLAFNDDDDDDELVIV
jgi:minichromosome maintenance protein 10